MDLMSEAIALHRSGRLSGRAKRDADKMLSERFAEAMQEIRESNPPQPVDKPAKWLNDAAHLRQLATMGSRSQAKKLIAKAEECERMAAGQ